LVVDRVQTSRRPLDVTILSITSLVERLEPPSASTTLRVQPSNPVVLKLRTSLLGGREASIMRIVRRGLIFLYLLCLNQLTK
jgi:hypothetical protein